MMGLVIAFWILAIVAVAGALGVVVIRNIFRAALSLVVCLLSVAGIFVTLSADFLAAVQILVYVGAISVLIILAIMMTREVPQGSPSNKLRGPALIVAVLFLGAISYAVIGTKWQISSTPPITPTTPALGQMLFSSSGYILPLEIAPVLLLGVILGAIVLIKEKQ